SERQASIQSRRPTRRHRGRRSPRRFAPMSLGTRLAQNAAKLAQRIEQSIDLAMMTLEASKPDGEASKAADPETDVGRVSGGGNGRPNEPTERDALQRVALSERQDEIMRTLVTAERAPGRCLDAIEQVGPDVAAKVGETCLGAGAVEPGAENWARAGCQGRANRLGLCDPCYMRRYRWLQSVQCADSGNFSKKSA